MNYRSAIELVRQLDTESWLDSCSDLKRVLKSELQGQDGLVREICSLGELYRQRQLSGEVDAFVDAVGDGSSIDEMVNCLASRIERINEKSKAPARYDFISMLSEVDLSKRPLSAAIKTFCNDSCVGEKARYRAVSLVNEVVGQSLSQGSKSQAGLAGEVIHEAIVKAAGGIKGVDYRLQYKSNEGSDTDCVFPAVEDKNDIDVDIFVAVQFSTNDRARMVTSELKVGGKKMVWIGNGLSASSKKISAIGGQILQDLRHKNIRLICYGPGLEDELVDLGDKARKNIKNSIDARERAKALREIAITYTEYFQFLKKRFKN